MNQSEIKPAVPNHILPIATWIVILCISDLPDAILNSLGYNFASLLAFKLVALGICLILSWMFKPLRPLWKFAFVFLVFYLANAGVDWVRTTKFWQSRFETEGVAYSTFFLPFHALDILRTLLVIAALWLVKRNRAEFFSSVDDLHAEQPAVHAVAAVGILVGHAHAHGPGADPDLAHGY